MSDHEAPLVINARSTHSNWVISFSTVFTLFLCVAVKRRRKFKSSLKERAKAVILRINMSRKGVEG